MPNTTDAKTESFEDKIRAWLGTQGYRFELVVARAFQKAGFEVTVSEFRRDPDTGTPREIDVVATHTSFLAPHRLFDLDFVIECKHSADKPWIVLRTAEGIKPLNADTYLGRFATRIGDIALIEMSIDSQSKATGLFSLPQSMAHGVRRCFEDRSPDMAYQAVTKVCSGAAALVADKQTSFVAGAIVFPVVIIQGRLFEYTIRDTKEPDLAEVHRATLFWRRPATQHSPHAVPVELLTEHSLEDYAKEKYQQCEALCPLIQSGLPLTHQEALSEATKSAQPAGHGASSTASATPAV